MGSRRTRVTPERPALCLRGFPGRPRVASSRVSDPPGLGTALGVREPRGRLGGHDTRAEKRHTQINHQSAPLPRRAPNPWRVTAKLTDHATTHGKTKKKQSNKPRSMRARERCAPGLTPGRTCSTYDLYDTIFLRLSLRLTTPLSADVPVPCSARAWTAACRSHGLYGVCARRRHLNADPHGRSASGGDRQVLRCQRRGLAGMELAHRRAQGKPFSQTAYA